MRDDFSDSSREILEALAVPFRNTETTPRNLDVQTSSTYTMEDDQGRRTLVTAYANGETAYLRCNEKGQLEKGWRIDRRGKQIDTYPPKPVSAETLTL